MFLKVVREMENLVAVGESSPRGQTWGQTPLFRMPFSHQEYDAFAIFQIHSTSRDGFVAAFERGEENYRPGRGMLFFDQNSRGPDIIVCEFASGGGISQDCSSRKKWPDPDVLFAFFFNDANFCCLAAGRRV